MVNFGNLKGQTPTAAPAQPATPPASKYATVSKARAQQSSSYFVPGHYLLAIERVTEGEAFKKGTFVAVEQRVLKTFEDSAGGFDYNRKTPVRSHVAGEAVSDILMISNVAFEGRLKTIMMVAGGITEEDFAQEKRPGELAELMVSDAQPLAGTVIEVRAKLIIKKESKAKTEATLTGDDVYTRVDYIRRVPFAEVKEVVDPQIAARFLPDLDKNVESEKTPATESTPKAS